MAAPNGGDPTYRQNAFSLGCCLFRLVQPMAVGNSRTAVPRYTQWYGTGKASGMEVSEPPPLLPVWQFSSETIEKEKDEKHTWQQGMHLEKWAGRWLLVVAKYPFIYAQQIMNCHVYRTNHTTLRTAIHGGFSNPHISYESRVARNDIILRQHVMITSERNFQDQSGLFGYSLRWCPGFLGFRGFGFLRLDGS
ncbi:hypothetical protein FQN57_006655 [Myotisia sp. PD_48]|nr:hypothetical protein FQN57_006655 [Myotisia sp. PD_48]